MSALVPILLEVVQDLSIDTLFPYIHVLALCHSGTKLSQSVICMYMYVTQCKTTHEMSCSWIPPQLSLFTTMCSYYSEPSIKVMGCREEVWFKNNFEKVFSACNYYAGVATTSNVVSSGVHKKSQR